MRTRHKMIAAAGTVGLAGLVGAVVAALHVFDADAGRDALQHHLRARVLLLHIVAVVARHERQRDRDADAAGDRLGNSERRR